MSRESRVEQLTAALRPHAQTYCVDMKGRMQKKKYLL